MTPPTVNAYYSSTDNKIGELQQQINEGSRECILQLLVAVTQTKKRAK